MPCSDGGYGFSETERNNVKRTEREAGKREVLRELEPLLCSACRALENADFDFSLNPALDKWWHNHKEQDRRREAAEAAQREREAYQARVLKEALNKPVNQLTATEIKLLRDNGYLK